MNNTLKKEEKEMTKKEKAKRKQKVYIISTLLILAAIVLATFQIVEMSRPTIEISIDNTILSRKGNLEDQQFKIDNIIVQSGKYRIKWQDHKIVEGKVFSTKEDGNFTTFYMKGEKETLTDVVINISSGDVKKYSGLSTTTTKIRIDLDFLNDMELWDTGEYY